MPVAGTEYDFEESFGHGNFVFPTYGTVFLPVKDRTAYDV